MSSGLDELCALLCDNDPTYTTAATAGHDAIPRHPPWRENPHPCFPASALASSSRSSFAIPQRALTPDSGASRPSHSRSKPMVRRRSTIGTQSTITPSSSPLPSSVSALNSCQTFDSGDRPPITPRRKDWTPSRAIASMGSVEDCHKSRERPVFRHEGDAETQLSHLYLENNERLASMASRGVGDDRSKSASRNWTSTLSGGVMNAGVFGAAVGLTAYRLWTGHQRDPDSGPSTVAGSATPTRGFTRPVSPTPTASPAPTSASSHADANHRRTHVHHGPSLSIDRPPPAYEDIDGAVVGTSKGKMRESEDTDSLFEPDTPNLLTPPTCRDSTLQKQEPHTLPHRQLHHHHYYHHRYAKPRRRHAPESSVSSSISIPSSHDVFVSPRSTLRTTFIPPPSHSIRRAKSESPLPHPHHEEGSSEEHQRGNEEDEEGERRLDMMAYRLHDLVIEGQAALASQVHVVDIRDDTESDGTTVGRRLRRRKTRKRMTAGKVRAESVGVRRGKIVSGRPRSQSLTKERAGEER